MSLLNTLKICLISISNQQHSTKKEYTIKEKYGGVVWVCVCVRWGRGNKLLVGLMNKEAALRTKPAVKAPFLSPSRLIFWGRSNQNDPLGLLLFFFLFFKHFFITLLMQENIQSLINTASWMFDKTRSLFETPWRTRVSICTYLWWRKSRKCDFGLWWITDVHFNLFTSFWSSSLSALVTPKIAGRWLTDQDCCGKKNDSFIYLFLGDATPRRKLRFQTVQSEFQMRCNSMENIKCQFQFSSMSRKCFLIPRCPARRRRRSAMAASARLTARSHPPKSSYHSFHFQTAAHLLKLLNIVYGSRGNSETNPRWLQLKSKVLQLFSQETSSLPPEKPESNSSEEKVWFLFAINYQISFSELQLSWEQLLQL